MKSYVTGWRRPAAWFSAAWLVLLGMTGCSDTRLSTGAASSEPATGVVEISLTTTTAVANYRLRNAVFEVSGPTSITLTSETDVDAEVITQRLSAGMYRVLLRDGWTLEKRTAAGYRAVEATLLSVALREITITAGETTALRYRFGTAGVVVELGDGQLDIGIEVDDTLDASVDADADVENCTTGTIACGAECLPSCAGRIRARAFIDGRSQLVIRGSDVWWRHFDFAAPGLHDPYIEPTELWSQVGAGPEQHVVWCPLWPTGCNTCEGTCGELRDMQIESLPFANLSPPLPSSGQASSLILTPLAGRGVSTIVQQPDALNDYMLVVEFDDNALGGLDYYDVSIDYTFSP